MGRSSIDPHCVVWRRLASGGGRKTDSWVRSSACWSTRKLLQARQADAVERFRSALDAFGLRRAIEMSRPVDCSPGERKMVEAALVEASGARFIIADEPFAGVAPTVTEALMTGLRRLTNGGAGACVSTHDLWVMQEFSSPMTWVTSGTTYQFASFQAAQREWAFTRDFLGHG